MTDLPSDRPELLSLKEWYRWLRSSWDCSAVEAMENARFFLGKTEREIRKHWASLFHRISRKTTDAYAKGAIDALHEANPFLSFLMRKAARTDGKSTVRIAYPFAQPKLYWLTPTLQKLVDTYLLADWMAQRG